MADRWAPPGSIEEGEALKLRLVDRLNDIEVQLSTRKKGGPACNGNYTEDSETFFDWRSRAVHAKNQVIKELRRLNLWLKQSRRERTADKARELGVDPKSPTSLLMAAANIFQRLRADGVDMDQEETDVFNAINHYLISTAGQGETNA